MGLVYTNIELSNGDDMAFFRRGAIGEDEIRRFEVNCLVDTGCVMLAINEEIRVALGLEFQGEKPSVLANRQRVVLPVAGPVQVRWEDRFCTTNALVLPDDTEPLLGAIPMEEMDLAVVPSLGEIGPAHPDGPLMYLK